MSHPKFVVYASELDAFKSFVSTLCNKVDSHYIDQPYPSAFKRNDAVSRAFGYKSHSDLVTQAKGHIEPEQHAHRVDRWPYYSEVIAQELASCYENFSVHQIAFALTNPVPKQTEFDVIDGTPIVQHSPLAPDIDHSYRDTEEIETWWNVPFIEEERRDGQPFRYDIMVMDGGAWDRATFKSHAWSLEDAVAIARKFKDHNSNYRDYAAPLDRAYHLDIDPSWDEDSMVRFILTSIMNDLISSRFDTVRFSTEKIPDSTVNNVVDQLSAKIIKLEEDGTTSFIPAFRSICADDESHGLELLPNAEALTCWYLLFIKP